MNDESWEFLGEKDEGNGRALLHRKIQIQETKESGSLRFLILDLTRLIK